MFTTSLIYLFILKQHNPYSITSIPKHDICINDRYTEQLKCVCVFFIKLSRIYDSHHWHIDIEKPEKFRY